MTARHDGLRKAALGTIGSGNVFADLGLPDPETELMKANLSIEMGKAVQKRGLAHATAAQIMAMAPSELTKLLHGRTEPTPWTT
ncbi:XRE family transcriptional regulator [Bradyrhizobium sp. INPA01-394B]|uniref:XRE family transcriptional regulator n=1 Tax=Bradyrhizobium campsiandrae TaxID=1729892 RepID=A0ABR7UKS8_9BRAD|nr:XRE family transcriptional regulator [Bradyrhizobium campsiandrae]MBC9879937.1 XRE family transcriptional regulator [Bradyrhizobium campsiandrae]MBC9984306.1 XRE family transcriptional regulator [Bradyrhizobium campsiandrae]